MTHQSQTGMEWLISEDCTRKALIIYHIKRYECQLDMLIDKFLAGFADRKELMQQCGLIIHTYKDYLSLWSESRPFQANSTTLDISWQDLQHMLDTARKRLAKACDSTDEQNAVCHLLHLYHQLADRLPPKEQSLAYQDEHRIKFKEFQAISKARTPEDWLSSLITFCNKHKVELSETMALFFKLNPKDIKNWRCFFTEQRYINLFNSVFYYKLHPQTLYDSSNISSEKLLSVYHRLDSIYQIIEAIQKQYIHLSVQHGLPPINDYLFHGNELPQGIVIQVDASSKGFIQSLLKQHQIKYLTPLDNQALHGILYDLCRAYKFWFNPSRLVDAVMVLQQMLVQQTISDDFNALDFREKMLSLYKQMKTTECLDLYGYFANKDTGYLLRILNAILSNRSLSWLTPLLDIEKKALLRVFVALKNIMEALREELAHRNIATEPYPVNYSKPVKQPGRRNSGAVKRVLAIYATHSLSENRSLEDLFSLVEHPPSD